MPNLASALPALFPTEHRYSATGIAYNLAVAIFGGTAPFIIASLIELTGNDVMPAYYLVAVAAVAAVTIRFLPESARRHLPGPMPGVESVEAARKLVETQDNNPLLDVDSLPFEESFEIVRIGGHNFAETHRGNGDYRDVERFGKVPALANAVAVDETAR